MNVNMNDNTIIATSSVSVNTPREEKLINLKEALIMTLVPMTQMLKNARTNKCAVGGFMIWNYDSAKAVMQTLLQKLGLPLTILSAKVKAISMGGFANVALYRRECCKNCGCSDCTALQTTSVPTMPLCRLLWQVTHLS